MANNRRFALQTAQEKRPSADLLDQPPKAVYFEAVVAEGQSTFIARDAVSGRILGYIKATEGDDETPPVVEQEMFSAVGDRAFRRLLELTSTLAKVGSHSDFVESGAGG